MANPLPKQWPALILWILFTSSSWISDAAELAGIAKSEKSRLEVGTAGSGTTSLPLFVALDGGYFSRRGLSVSVNQLGATVAVQGIISGTVDIYQGGTAAIAANLAGCSVRKGSPRLRVFVANQLPRPFPARLEKSPFG